MQNVEEFAEGSQDREEVLQLCRQINGVLPHVYGAADAGAVDVQSILRHMIAYPNAISTLMNFDDEFIKAPDLELDPSVIQHLRSSTGIAEIQRGQEPRFTDVITFPIGRCSEERLAELAAGSSSLIDTLKKPPKFRPHEMRQLKAQLVKHVQLLTQLAVSSFFEFDCDQVTDQFMAIIGDLEVLRSTHSESSLFNIPNLMACLETRNRMMAIGKPSPETFVRSNDHGPEPRFLTRCVLSTSRAILFPELLPKTRLCHKETTSKFSKAEVALIALGLYQFSHLRRETFHTNSQILTHFVPAKGLRQIRFHLSYNRAANAFLYPRAEQGMINLVFPTDDFSTAVHDIPVRWDRSLQPRWLQKYRAFRNRLYETAVERDDGVRIRVLNRGDEGCDVDEQDTAANTADTATSVTTDTVPNATTSAGSSGLSDAYENGSPSSNVQTEFSVDGIVEFFPNFLVAPTPVDSQQRLYSPSRRSCSCDGEVIKVDSAGKPSASVEQDGVPSALSPDMKKPRLSVVISDGNVLTEKKGQMCETGTCSNNSMSEKNGCDSRALTPRYSERAPVYGSTGWHVRDSVVGWKGVQCSEAVLEGDSTAGCSIVELKIGEEEIETINKACSSAECLKEGRRKKEGRAQEQAANSEQEEKNSRKRPSPHGSDNF